MLEMTEVHDLTFGEPSDEGVGTEASKRLGKGFTHVFLSPHLLTSARGEVGVNSVSL